jgi:hypothetical protein
MTKKPGKMLLVSSEKNSFFHCSFAEWVTFDICGLTATTETKASPSHLTTKIFEHYYQRLIGGV